MQGYVYTRDNNGTKEAVVVDKNVGKTIALSSFSGYLAISGGIINEGLKAAGAVTKRTAIGKNLSYKELIKENNISDISFLKADINKIIQD